MHDAHPMKTRAKNGITQPRLYLTLLLTCMEPCTISQTLNDQIWLARIKVEYVALENNGTWTLVEPLKCKKLIGFKWVIRVKENLDGSIKNTKLSL